MNNREVQILPPKDLEEERLKIESRKADAMFAIAKALEKLGDQLNQIGYEIRRAS